MKKIVYWLLLVILLNCGCIVLAEEHVAFNVDDYTSSELAEIYSIVSSRIFDRVIVPTGFYVVGEDLPAGKYVILSSLEDKELKKIGWSFVATFESVDDFKAEPSYSSWSESTSKSLSNCCTLYGDFPIELTDGMVLAIGYHAAGVRKIESNVLSSFWD